MNNDKAAEEWGSWLSLMHYFSHEFEEGEITRATYEVMTSSLMVLKPRVVIDYEKV